MCVRVYPLLPQRLNSGSQTEVIHSGNRKTQNLLKCPIFNGEPHDMIEI